jgi:Methyltransferase domain
MAAPLRSALLVIFLLLLPLVRAAPLSASESDYTPKSGQPGKDVVWVPSPMTMVEKLLDMAAVTTQDYVIDLGSGDGRTVIAAAKRGARAHGIEYDSALVDLSKRNAAKEGMSDKATFEKADVFVADFSKATVVTLFLTPEMNIRLRPRLLDLKPGTRIVANTFGIGDWNADRISTITGNCERWCIARLWIVPAKVGGKWQLPQGDLTIKQIYQTFSGTMAGRSGTVRVAGRLRGDEIFFAGGKTRFTGRVNGDVIEGFAREAGKDSEFRARRTGN